MPELTGWRWWRVRPTGRDVPTVTPFEIFFDLVFVFTLTRIVAFMGKPPDPVAMGRGLLLLMLLWFAWSGYLWLGNQTRVDRPPVRVLVLAAMAGFFVAALVMPGAWDSAPGLDGPLVLALSYVLLRAIHLALYHWAGEPVLRRRIRRFAVASVLAWVPLLVGAVLGGWAQTWLWVLAFLVEIGGQRGVVQSRLGGWPVRSPEYFAERHGLVLIIALGESFLAAGVGVGTMVTKLPVLAGAVVGFVLIACLWLVHFDRVSPLAERALLRASGERRDRIGADVYSLGHLPLIAGVIYTALGFEDVLALISAGGRPAGEPLEWPGAVALYGGSALYLLGTLLVRYLSGRGIRTSQLVVAVVPLLLLPVGLALPALLAIGLLTTYLVGVVLLPETPRGGRRPADDPSAG
ncbi:low temperature requirement protein A [Micromonospora sp. C95]|uniref:low temperature requirement protein A n=1 Tax=Micromonospora sp. C95 TaxID=2824882 RepID=UPI001B372D98|nr:low temperature requirement protein A [Micromonospora sp. C95]MBQ1023555.1 low temperature requirement protein A [Micromonospora sp. C95]